MPIFELNMPDVELSDGRKFDLISIKWSEKTAPAKLNLYMAQWASEQFFLTRRMPDLNRVGHATLSIMP